MANFIEQDLPIETSEEVDFDNPDVTRSTKKFTQATDMRNFITYQAASIDNAVHETPIAEAFQNISRTGNPDAVLGQKAAEKVEDDKSVFMEAFISAPGETETEIQENYDVTQELIEQLDEEVKDPDLAYVKAVSQGTLQPEQEKRLAVELKLSKMMRQIWDEMGTGDVITAGLGLLVPGNVVKDNIDLTGSAFNAREYMENFVLNFKRQSPDEQLEQLPVIKEILFEELDNEFKVLGVLNALLEPGGEEDLGEFDTIWAALDVADAAFFGAVIATKLTKITSKLNAIKTAARAGDRAMASDINAASVVDESVAQGANVDRPTTAVSNATGFNVESLDAARQGDISTDTLNNLEAFNNQLRTLRADLITENNFIKESLLHNEERKAAEIRKLDELKDHPSIENISIVERQNDKTIFKMDTIDSEGNIIPAKYTMQVSLNDIGRYEQSVVGTIEKFTASPSVWAKGNLKTEVEAAQRLDSAQAIIFNQLIQMQREATKSILGPLGLKGVSPRSRRKLAQLDEVLRVGDVEQKVYTPMELRAGVNGIPLDDSQIEAYYKIRSLVDNLYILRNDFKREELALKGLKNVNLRADMKQLAKPYETAQEARGSLNISKPSIIWRQDRDKMVKASDIDLTKEYADGFRLVRFDEATDVMASGEKVHYGLIRANNVTKLPLEVLHYRTGYIPKINLQAAYFVKKFAPNRIDGISHGAESGNAEVTTLRAFDNRADAEKWAKAQQDADPNNIYRALEDRQLEKERRISGLSDNVSHGGGGLYTGARSSEEIPFGLDGVDPERLNSFESVSRNIANVARYVSRNEWRMGMEQRALNTANNLIPGIKFKSFEDLASAPDTQQGRFLKKLHSQVEDWMGFPTKEEQLWEAVVQNFYESAIGKKLPGIAKKSLNYIKHKDPIASARSAAFHSLLGWFNPIQFWVQAQGAAVAISANIFNPVELGRVIKAQTALAAVDHLDDPAHIAHAAKAFGIDDLAEIRAAWKQTGLRDAILQTADHAAAVRGHGIAMDALSRTSNKALLVYRAGELFNRRTAFITSYRQWKKANPGKVVNNDAMKTILAKTNNYILNLGRANRAQWQRGVLGLPTQFLQVSTKTLETLLGVNGHFTAAERGKIFFTQMMLYGAAGVPLGSMGATWLAQSLGITSQSDLEAIDPEVRKAINEGFTGWATMAMFGIDIDVGQRSSLANGINQFVDQMLFEESTVAEMMMGAFGTTATRFWDGLTGTFEPLSLGLAGVRHIDPYQASTLLLEPISSWRNSSKALFMHRFNRIIDRRGSAVLHKDFSPAEEIAQAIGFRLTQEVQVRQLRDINKAKADLRADVVNTAVETIWNYSVKMEFTEDHEQLKQQTRDKLALLIQSLDTNYERKLAREAIEKRLTEGKDQYSREWRKFRQNHNDGSIDILQTWHNRLVSDGLIQQRTVEEE